MSLSKCIFPKSLPKLKCPASILRADSLAQTSKIPMYHNPVSVNQLLSPEDCLLLLSPFCFRNSALFLFLQSLSDLHILKAKIVKSIGIFACYIACVLNRFHHTRREKNDDFRSTAFVFCVPEKISENWNFIQPGNPCIRIRRLLTDQPADNDGLAVLDNEIRRNIILVDDYLLLVLVKFDRAVIRYFLVQLN